MTTPLKTESETTLPQDLEAVIALAEKNLISVRRVASCAYAIGRYEGVLALIGTKAPAVETEVAA